MLLLLLLSSLSYAAWAESADGDIVSSDAEQIQQVIVTEMLLNRSYTKGLFSIYLLY
jgi:hypothetical protein